MKKLFGKSFLALVLAMTMLMGMSMTAMAGQVGEPEKCFCTEHTLHAYIIEKGAGSADGVIYGSDGSKLTRAEVVAPNNAVEIGKWYAVVPRNLGGYAPMVPCANCEAPTPAKTSSSHTHNYEWATLSDPTTEQDGVEAYICSCGDIQATQPISAAHNILKSNADAVKNAKAGATVVVELGRLNSLPKWFVTKLVERDDLNVTLKITYNHENYTLEVPKTATIEDESIEWYGPLKLSSMFPQK